MSLRGSAPVVAFAGGGTGGHLFPGLAVARWLRQADPNLAVLFFTTGRALERRLLEEGEFPAVRLWSLPAPRYWWGWPLTALSQAATVASALGELRRRGTSALVALGGYGSVGPGLAAWLLGRPLILLEQNSIPGKATRLLSLFADVVCTAWPQTAAGLWRRTFAVTTGNPLRPEILGGDLARAARAGGLEQGKPVLLILGGSQGASAVNRWVTDALPGLARALPDLQVIHQTGERDHGWVAEAYGRTGLRAWVTPFLTEMGDCYALATVALARAGATTLSELAATGVPAILVPYPHAADDHQRANARLVAGRGGAVVVEETEFARTDLVALVGELLGDEERRRRMAEALRRMARPQATALVARCVQALLLHPHARSAALVAGHGR